MNSTVGILHWDACDTCKNYDENNNPFCAVDKDIDDNMIVSFEEILCGLYVEK